MKKTFIIIFTLLILPQFVGAQTVEQDFPDDRLGIRGGYNFSKIDSDLGSNTVRRKSLHLGIFYQYFLSDNFSLQPEVQYSSEGWIKEFASSPDKEAKLHFVNLTLAGKFYFWKDLNFQAGIQPAFLLDGSEEEAGTNPVGLDQHLHRFNLGAVFGIGYDFGFGLRLGGRYVQGLIDINDGFRSGSFNDEIKTTTFQAYIGYSFGLSRSDQRRNNGR